MGGRGGSEEGRKGGREELGKRRKLKKGRRDKQGVKKGRQKGDMRNIRKMKEERKKG